jgi:tetratricopeptide (TPR) repeat protein
MEAAFRDASMQAAFQEASARSNAQMAEMEAAFQSAGRGSMEAAFNADPAMEAAFAQASNADMQAAFDDAAGWAEEFRQQTKPGFLQDMDQQAGMEAAKQMADTLRRSGNPKFENSQFVQFIDQVGQGNIKFLDNKVVDREGKEVDWESLYNAEVAGSDSGLGKAWGSAGAGRTLDDAWAGPNLEEAWGKGKGDFDQAWGKGKGKADFDAAWGMSGPEDAMSAAWMGKGKGDLEDAWAGKGNGALDAAWESGKFGLDMESAWKGGKGKGGMDAAWDGDFESAWGIDQMSRAWEGMGMEDAWADLGDLQNAWDNSDLLDKAWSTADAYDFKSDNPYMNESDCLGKAQQLIKEGKDNEAILCLEAEVQKNPQSSEGWRLLGELHASLDDDLKAISCLRKGHDADPYNLDSLLALGVSLTNEIEHNRALQHLRTWLENHDEYSGVVKGPAPPEFHMLKEDVVQLFEQACNVNPLDADVQIALAVVHHIGHNYEAAIRRFKQAAELRPNEHTIWNKLGATLANSGHPRDALLAYHQALQIKPNFTRAWSNLAIAHTVLNEGADAARFYLTALRISPQATHLWRTLSGCVAQEKMRDIPGLRDAVHAQDMEACCKLISGVVGPEGLPPPNTQVSPQAARLLTSEIGPPDSGRPIDLPFRGDERESLFEAAFDKALDDI